MVTKFTVTIAFIYSFVNRNTDTFRKYTEQDVQRQSLSIQTYAFG